MALCYYRIRDNSTNSTEFHVPAFGCGICITQIYVSLWRRANNVRLLVHRGKQSHFASSGKLAKAAGDCDTRVNSLASGKRTAAIELKGHSCEKVFDKPARLHNKLAQEPFAPQSCVVFMNAVTPHGEQENCLRDWRGNLTSEATGW